MVHKAKSKMFINYPVRAHHPVLDSCRGAAGFYHDEY